MKSKMKEIEKLYARAKSGGKDGKGKGKGGKDGKRKARIDGRLKQDLKSQKRQALKTKGKGRGKGKGGGGGGGGGKGKGGKR